jgi:hypothetical protein
LSNLAADEGQRTNQAIVGKSNHIEVDCQKP